MNKKNFAELNRIVKSDDVTEMKSFIKHNVPSGVKIDKAFMDLSKERGYTLLGLSIQFSAIQCIDFLLHSGAKSVIIRTEKFDTMIAACIDYHIKNEHTFNMAIEKSLSDISFYINIHHGSTKTGEQQLCEYLFASDMRQSMSLVLSYFPNIRFELCYINEDSNLDRLLEWFETGVIKASAISNPYPLAIAWLSQHYNVRGINDDITDEVSFKVMLESCMTYFWPKEQIELESIISFVINNGIENKLPTEVVIHMVNDGLLPADKSTVDSFLHSICSSIQFGLECDKKLLVMMTLDNMKYSFNFNFKTIKYYFTIALHYHDVELLVKLYTQLFHFRHIQTLLQEFYILLCCEYSTLAKEFIDHPNMASLRDDILNLQNVSAKGASLFPDNASTPNISKRCTDHTSMLLTLFTFGSSSFALNEHLDTKDIMIANRNVKYNYLRLVMIAYAIEKRGIEEVAKHMNAETLGLWLTFNSPMDLIAHIQPRLKTVVLSKMS